VETAVREWLLIQRLDL